MATDQYNPTLRETLYEVLSSRVSAIRSSSSNKLQAAREFSKGFLHNASALGMFPYVLPLMGIDDDYIEPHALELQVVSIDRIRNFVAEFKCRHGEYVMTLTENRGAKWGAWTGGILALAQLSGYITLGLLYAAQLTGLENPNSVPHPEILLLPVATNLGAWGYKTWVQTRNILIREHRSGSLDNRV